MACDMHPDYLSTRYAESTGLPMIMVQHHHAHVCSCMAEYGLDREVIGVALDGTGYGDDGAIWGYEFIVCSLENYTRFSHLGYFPLPGGDLCVREPWRTAASCIHNVLGIHPCDTGIDCFKKLDSRDLDFIILALEKKINTPLTSSMGRLFDAVAVLLGLCDTITFEAEGPLRLESIADMTVSDSYGYETGKIIRIEEILNGIIKDIRAGKARTEIAGRFHRTMTDMIVETVLAINRETGIPAIVLAGGIFQNRKLLKGVMGRLFAHKLDVYVPRMFPVNDGGISLGQIVSAAKRRS